MLQKFSAILIVFSIFLAPFQTLAQKEAPISRRAAYLLIWSAINRPVQTVREKAFTDVPKGSEGFDVITYGKHRGMIDDADAFHPNEPLDLQTALLWIFRTRNIIEFPRITVENFPMLLARFPVLDGFDLQRKSYADRLLTTSELKALLAKTKDVADHEVQLVTYYADAFQGQGTAFGEKFDMNDFTAASRYLPYNTLVKVTNPKTGTSVVVRINDTGPWVKEGSKYYDRLNMDLSKAAFQVISETGRGVLEATIERLGDVSLVKDEAPPSALKSQDVCIDSTDYIQRRITAKVILDPGIPQFLKLGDAIRTSANEAFIVRQVALPDGSITKLQSWILKGDTYAFTPSVVGSYTFTLGTKDGRAREMTVQVKSCDSPESPK